MAESNTTGVPGRAGPVPVWRSPTTLVVIICSFVIVLVAVKAGADPDLWGHIRFGQDIIEAGRVIKVDPYSFTSDREWVNHEWLAEVVMAAAWDVGGTAGLVGLKALILATMLGIIAWVGRREGLPRLAMPLLLVLAAVAVSPRATTVRPQLFSLVFFAAELVILHEHERRGRRWALLLLPPLFAVWVNAHGGWLVGGGVLAAWAVAHLAAGELPGRDRVLLFGAGAMALAATLANPYGLHMWRFLFETVGFGRPNIADWQPIWRVPAPLVSWAVVIAVVALLWKEGHLPRSSPRVAVVSLLGAASLKVSRIDAFFALAGLVLLLPWLTQAIREVAASERRSRQAVPAALALAACASVAGGGFVLVGQQVRCITIAADDSYPEPEALRFVERAALRGRMVNFFNHGEYFIWHLAPALQVSMDGRRETVYSEAVLADHARLYDEPSAGSDYPGTVGADLVWLPNGLGAAPFLKKEGWVPIFEGPVTTVYSREANARTVSSTTSPGDRCFPGP